MRWPFALRSSVDLWRDRHGDLLHSATLALKHTAEANDRVAALQKRLVEITDLDRTTPEVMANVFSEWDSGQQATFFNVLGRLTHEWEHARCFQFSHIVPSLDDEGTAVLIELAQYASPT